MRDKSVTTQIWAGWALPCVLCPLAMLAVAQGGWSGGSLAFTVAALAALPAGAALSLGAVRAQQVRLGRLEEQCTQLARELYQRDRQRQESSAAPSPSAASEKAGGASGECTAGGVNYPLLLLTLQDVGRRVTTNLDLETLFSTIISTAKGSLRCGCCEVYLWNPRENTLRNASPQRPRDRAAYVPRPQAGMAGWVLANRQIITRQAIKDDYTLQRLAQEETELPDAIAPLAVGGELLGLLIVDDVEEDSQNFVRLLYVLANIYALGIKNAQLFRRIEDMARRDGLTGLLNHATFQEALQELVAQALASSTPLTVVMSDIDRFKTFNDVHGHQAGDQVLREVARLWKAVLPEYAVIARYGGEEFICALPHVGVERGRELAELLRQAIAEQTIDFAGRELRVTSSFGVAELSGTVSSGAELIRTADALLYRAKELGRNRVVACSRLGEAAQLATTA